MNTRLHPTVRSHTGVHKRHTPRTSASALLMSCFMRRTLSVCGVTIFCRISGNPPALQIRAVVLLTPTSTSTLQGFSLSGAVLIVACTCFLTIQHTHKIVLACIRLLSPPPHVLWFLVCGFCTAWPFLGTHMRCCSKADGMSTVALLCLLFSVLSLCVPSRMTVHGAQGPSIVCSLLCPQRLFGVWHRAGAQ